MNDSHPSTGARGLTAAELADVEAIFAEASDLATDMRPGLLDSRCNGRARVRAEVEALLRSHDEAGGFLDGPAAGALQDAGDDGELVNRLQVGSSIGPYRLVEKIGEGGMAEVFLADRADGLFTHRAAVKVTRASGYAGEAARRFPAERQILASLQHPHVVTLLDGGTTVDGQAYLVMEHVDGVPITTYCSQRDLKLDGRLRLLREVCSAVQYAHQRGIVHRDLKPANILVTSEGIPKVLDFGVAKLLEGPVAAPGTVTSLMPGPLTPNYASPEQLRGLPVTTACDVYALGVLAYEVITGRRPYETTGKTLDEVLDLVLHTQPARPSTTAANGPDVSQVDRAATRRALKGDLDAIVLRAMSKEPERRYRSAGELADDIDRFLSGKPVVAREPSMGYVLRRMAGRNKAAVTVALASLVAIVGALGVALWQRHVALDAQRRAEQRFSEVRKLANAIIFKIHDEVAPLPGSTPVRQMIVNEALAYLERLSAESAGDESLQWELAGAYRQIGAILGDPGRANLGDRKGALQQAERARSLMLPLANRPSPDPKVLISLVNSERLLASLYGTSGQRERAKEFAQSALFHAEQVNRIAPQYPLAGDVLAKTAFSVAMTMHPGESSIPYWQRARELMERELAGKPDDPERQRNVALVEKYLGGALDGLGRDEEAEGHYRRALEIDEKRLAAAPNNQTAQFDVAIDIANVASMADLHGRLDEAYALFARSLQLREQLRAADPRDRLAVGRAGYARRRLSILALKLKRPAEALAHARAAVAIQEKLVAQTGDLTTKLDVGEAFHALARAETALGHVREGCAAYRKSNNLFVTVRQSNQSYNPRRDTKQYEDSAAEAVRACDARETHGR